MTLHHPVSRRALLAGSGSLFAWSMLPRLARAEGRDPRLLVIILRGDSGFCNDELMGWCEANRVDYVFGMARNRRLEAALVNQLAEAKRLCAASGRPARVFRDFQYCTIDSWSRTRRVVGKADFAAWIKARQAQFAPISKALDPYARAYFPAPQRRGG